MRGWLTTEAPTVAVCRSFVIPVEFLAIVMGALDQLTYPSSYEQFGTLTPQEMADQLSVVMNTYTTTEGDCMSFGSIGDVFMRSIPPIGASGDCVLCDGSVYLKSEYPEYWSYVEASALESVWETDATHFKVPDLIGRFPMGDGAVNLNVEGGEIEHVLTIAEMPAHTHGEQDPGVVNVQSGVGAVPQSDPGLGSQTGSTGGGIAHNNMPPYTSLLPYTRLRGGTMPDATPAANRAGEIVAYYGTELPELCLTCGGGSYLKATFPLLWAVLETEMVGAVKVFEETSTTFKTPDLRGRTLIGYGQGIGLTNRNDPVANIGAETHQLAATEMPAHTHTEVAYQAGAMTYQGGTNRNAPGSVSQNTGSAGGGQAHNNMQPSRAVRYAIRYA